MRHAEKRWKTSAEDHAEVYTRLILHQFDAPSRLVLFAGPCAAVAGPPSYADLSVLGSTVTIEAAARS